MLRHHQRHSQTQTCPTVREWLETVEAASSPDTRRTYKRYWNLLVEEHGDLRLDKVRTTRLKATAKLARAKAEQRKNSRDGHSAEEHFVSAARCLFNHAAEDGLIEKSPAEKLPKPSRLESRRGALTRDQVAEIWQVVTTTGNDRELDALIVRCLLESGARKGGLLKLRLQDLDFTTQCIRLREKNNTQRWQPVSRTLMDALADLATQRGARR